MGVESISTTFDISPIFFVETARVQAGTTDCVLLQQFFTDIATYATEELYKILESQDHQKINKLDDWVHKKMERYSLYTTSRGTGLEIIPCATILNRISRPLLSPGFFFYLCNEQSSEKVREKISEIRKMELETLKELDTGDINSGAEQLGHDLVESIVNINKMEGDLLGYPQCCVSQFIRSREEGRNHETDIALQCLKNKDLDLALDCFLTPQEVKDIELPNSFHSHFTSNFYPCSTGCEKAIAISKRNEQYFGSFNTAYKGRLILNVMYHLATCYGSYQIIRSNNLKLINDYRTHVWKFFDRFDEESLQFMEKIKDLIIYSPNEIGDTYIKKVTGQGPQLG
ncbi:MAG: DUF483 domain-containing protein [Archaeoglobaceae archaeon]